MPPPPLASATPVAGGVPNAVSADPAAVSAAANAAAANAAAAAAAFAAANAAAMAAVGATATGVVVPQGGAMAAAAAVPPGGISADRRRKHTDFLYNVRFKSNIPKLPFDPKSLRFPLPEDMLYKYRLSSLEKYWPYTMPAPDILLDLVDLGVFSDDLELDAATLVGGTQTGQNESNAHTELNPGTSVADSEAPAGDSINAAQQNRETGVDGASNSSSLPSIAQKPSGNGAASTSSLTENGKPASVTRASDATATKSYRSARRQSAYIDQRDGPLFTIPDSLGESSATVSNYTLRSTALKTAPTSSSLRPSENSAPSAGPKAGTSSSSLKEKEQTARLSSSQAVVAADTNALLRNSKSNNSNRSEVSLSLPTSSRFISSSDTETHGLIKDSESFSPKPLGSALPKASFKSVLKLENASLKSQIKVIDSTFAACKDRALNLEHLRHPRNPSLRAVAAYPVFPDVGLHTNQYCHVSMEQEDVAADTSVKNRGISSLEDPRCGAMLFPRLNKKTCQTIFGLYKSASGSSSSSGAARRCDPKIMAAGAGGEERSTYDFSREFALGGKPVEQATRYVLAIDEEKKRAYYVPIRSRISLLPQSAVREDERLSSTSRRTGSEFEHSRRLTWEQQIKVLRHSNSEERKESAVTSLLSIGLSEDLAEEIAGGATEIV